MKFFVVAALLAVAAAAPSSYPTPAYPAAPAYPSGYKSTYSPITLTAESDVRNLDGSGAWSYAQSDYTTREESYAQKQLPGYSNDAYGKDYGYNAGNTQKGAHYYISPEGEKITLTFVADENGYQPKGDHLPTPPPIPEEIARMLPTLPKLVEEYPAYNKPAYPKTY